MKKIILLLMMLIVIYISFMITFKYLFNKHLKNTVTNEKIVNYLLDNNLSSKLNKANKLDNILNINIKRPELLIKHTLGNVITNNNHDHDNIPSKNSSYIEDPNPVHVNEPVVYIYNTHQTEAYESKALEPYNIEPNVMMCSYLLKEKLNDLGLPTIVETGNIGDILRKNKWPYYKSYVASRMLFKEAVKKNKSLKFFIDIHRDSSSRKYTTTNIDGTSYAKVMFVVGKEHKNYKKNLELASNLNNKVKGINKDLSRGIILKEGAHVNGIYNQDLSENTILIELGGQYNTIEEASNTINILTNILYDYIKGLL